MILLARCLPSHLGHLTPVLPMEQMARSSPSSARPDRITREDALHPGIEVRSACFDQQMDMIAHDDITRKLPTVADHGMFESLDRASTVRIIADGFLPGFPRAIT